MSDQTQPLPPSSLLHFSDFEPYCETIAHVDLRMRVLGFESPRYSITQAAVGRLAVQWAQEGSGQLSEGATDHAAIGLYVQLDPRPRLLNGMVLDPHAVVVFPPGSEFCFSCTNANSWFSVRIPLELLGPGNGNGPLDLHRSVTVIRPGSSVLRRLSNLVTAYLRALNSTDSLGDSAAASRRFEDRLLRIARPLCCRSNTARIESRDTFSTAKLRHERIAELAADILEASEDGSHSVHGLAQALDVSERTLLTAFKSRFGTTPRRFIQSMRLNRARMLLREKSPLDTRVQDVAATCGYWDFGRFAAKYHQLFGELPSDTLGNA